MLIKVCGMKYADNITELSDSDIDLMGFIFFKGSKRYTERIPADVPERIKKTGVFVNQNVNEVIETAKLNKLDYIQLHGDEDLNYCLTIGKSAFKLIKVFRIDEAFDFDTIKEYEDPADMFLFDTKSQEYGGTGKKFNWEVLKNYTGNLPFLLSGGISPEDHSEIMTFNHKCFKGIDINSRFEIQAGIKDADQIDLFIRKVKRV